MNLSELALLILLSGFLSFLFSRILSYEISPIGAVAAAVAGVASVLPSYYWFGLDMENIVFAAMAACLAANCVCWCNFGKIPIPHIGIWYILPVPDEIAIKNSDFAPGAGKYARSRPNIPQQRRMAAWVAAGFAILAWWYIASELAELRVRETQSGFVRRSGGHLIMLPAFIVIISWLWIYFGGRILGMFKRSFWFAGQIIFAIAFAAIVNALWYEYGEAKCGPNSPPGAEPPFCTPIKLK